MPRTPSRVQAERIESGLDWITWVVPHSKETREIEWVGDHLIEQEAAQGSKVKETGFLGYRGRKCSRIFTGSRPDGRLLRISGDLASTAWTLLQSSSGRPTRLDVQTSFWLTEPQTHLGTRLTSSPTAKSFTRRGPPLRRTTQTDNFGLACGTVGKRASPFYLRVYDKGTETKTEPPGRYWRWELEAKSHLAEELWREFLAAEDKTRWCYECCERSGRYSRVFWPLPPSSCAGVLPAARAKQPADVSRTFKWLETTVAPTIERLVAALGTSAVLRALGLDGYAIPLTELTEDEKRWRDGSH